MLREAAIELMRGAACSKTVPSLLSDVLSQAQALKMVRHYVKCCPKGAELGRLVSDRVMLVTKYRRKHS